MSTEASKIDYQALLREGYLQLKALRERIDTLERARTEPIAIVGMGCRFPGGAEGPSKFWRMLAEGVDATRDVPADRWDVDAFYDRDPDVPGRMYVRRGAFLDEIDRFDAGFFNISPRECVSMDPQQRLLMEVAWEAIEDAGLARDALAGKPAGVYVGVMFHDYAHLIASAGLQHIDTYYGTGNGVAFLAGRLSYYLGLTGPSLVLDTACSSSLVAVHLACQGLRSGETDLALACGVNLILSPVSSVVMSRLRALAPDGRCKTFDAAADGYGRGEGCGVVVLKRLSDAIAAGDQIWAVIRGSAVNQDGAGAGITVPNGLAQQAVIRRAMAEAKVTAEQIGYVEAHGTGTRLGDPLELRSLWSVLKDGRSVDAPLVVGSLKTNVGHMEGAAGIGSLIKTVLALRHGCIPPHLHVRQLNPLIAEEGIPLQIPQSLMPWPIRDGSRIAGVSSFGMSGTNAHMIVEAAPAADGPVGRTGGASVLCLSARKDSELRELASRYCQYLRREEAAAFEDVCFTAAVGRTHWNHRLAVIADDAEDCERKLASWLEGHADGGVVTSSGSGGSVEAPAADGLQRVARDYVAGAAVDFASLYKDLACHKVSLPTYPFSRERFWIDLPQSPSAGERASNEVLEQLLYEVKWHRLDLTRAPAREPHSYLLVAKDSALAGQIHEALQLHGMSGSVVEAANSSAVAAPLHECQTRSPGAPVEVIYLEGTAVAEPLSATKLRKSEDLSWRPLLELMQSLVTVAAGGKARLWVVTRGLHAVEPDERCVQPEGAVLWGLGKVFALEHPDLWGGLIDMPAATSAADVQQLLAEVSAEAGEDHVALRQGRRYVARLERAAQLLSDGKWPVDDAGVYWITGGLGAVGVQVAEWLVRRGARHLVLQARKGLPDRAGWPAALASGDAEVRRRIEFIRRLESLGAAVHVLAADVAAEEFLPKAAALLEEIAQPLKAIFHAAGVSGLQTIAAMTPEHLHRVLAAKVAGTWNLHALASRWPSAAFVAFSSIASIWGSRGLAHYAAGNAFLDAFMHYRHGLGLRGLSVNFGPIAGGGMDLAREEQRLRRIGIRTLAASQVSSILDGLWSGSVAQITAVDVDWSTFKPVYEAQRSRPLLSLLGPQANVAAADEAPRRPLLASAAPGERAAMAEAYLLEQTAAVLKADTSQLDPAEPLIALGVDSLMAMELQKRVRTQLDVDLPVATFLQGATLRELAQRIAGGLDAGQAEASQAGSSETVEGEL